jgi:hypothetical protein
MTINPVTPKSFQFGSYTLDVARGYQRTAEHNFDLRPKCFPSSKPRRATVTGSRQRFR